MQEERAMMGEPALMHRLICYIFFLLGYAFELLKRELSFCKRIVLGRTL